MPRLEVQEHRLSNGIQVFLVERPGTGRVFVGTLFKNGTTEEPTHLLGARKLLMDLLYSRSLPGDLIQARSAPRAVSMIGTEALLQQEDSLSRALREEKRAFHRIKGQSGDKDNLQNRSEELETAIDILQTRLREKHPDAPFTDLLEQAGCLRQGAWVNPDAMMHWAELPSSSLATWFILEAERLDKPLLIHFHSERSALLDRLEHEVDPQSKLRLLFFNAAFNLHPYGKPVLGFPGTVALLERQDLQRLNERLRNPSNLAVILVGDVRLSETLPYLERHLGKLLPVPPGPETAPLLEEPVQRGERRVQTVMDAEPRLMIGWKVPPHHHPDYPSLLILSRILGRGALSRLHAGKVGQWAVPDSIQVSLGVPGSRDQNLLFIELLPRREHSVLEVEQAVHSEILRLHQEMVPAAEVAMVQAGFERELLEVLDDPKALAEQLGKAWARGEDWHRLSSWLERFQSVTPEKIQLVAQRYLQPTNRTTAYSERDPMGGGPDPIDAQLKSILTALTRQKIEDPAVAENLVFEALRQIRQLPISEKEKTLKLLQAQLGQP